MLCGELTVQSGQVRRQFGSTLAYAPQVPFIMQGSIRDNILFGQEYEVTSYNTVVKACGLEPDFQQLRDGDHTVVGQCGLSGGQRARCVSVRA